MHITHQWEILKIMAPKDDGALKENWTFEGGDDGKECSCIQKNFGNISQSYTRILFCTPFLRSIHFINPKFIFHPNWAVFISMLPIYVVTFIFSD
jgi:hypothetical protein